MMINRMRRRRILPMRWQVGDLAEGLLRRSGLDLRGKEALGHRWLRLRCGWRWRRHLKGEEG